MKTKSHTGIKRTRYKKLLMYVVEIPIRVSSKYDMFKLYVRGEEREIYSIIRKVVRELRKELDTSNIGYERIEERIFSVYVPAGILREDKLKELIRNREMDNVQVTGFEKSREISIKAIESIADMVIDRVFQKQHYRRYRSKEYLIPYDIWNEVFNSLGLKETLRDGQFRVAITTDVMIIEGSLKLLTWLDIRGSAGLWLSTYVKKKFKKDPHKLKSKEAERIARSLEKYLRNKRLGFRTRYGFVHGKLIEVLAKSTKEYVVGNVSLYERLKSTLGEEHPDNIIIRAHLGRRDSEYSFVPCHVFVYSKRSIPRDPNIVFNILNSLWSISLESVFKEVCEELANI